MTNSQTSPILADSTGTYLLHGGLLALPTASKKAGQNPPSPELFLEAIEMFLEGEPAKRLDSTPRVRNIVDNGKNAKEKGGGRNQRIASRRVPHISHRDDRSTHPFQPETSARGHPNLTRMETSNCLNPLEHNTTTQQQNIINTKSFGT